jgi:hypothetical protein
MPCHLDLHHPPLAVLTLDQSQVGAFDDSFFRSDVSLEWNEIPTRKKSIGVREQNAFKLDLVLCVQRQRLEPFLT